MKTNRCIVVEQVLLRCIIFCSLLVLPAAPVAASEQEISKAVKNFFQCFSQKKYEAAYDYFSLAVKQEIPFPRFREKAADIESAKIVDIRIFDSDCYLAKMKVKARIHMRYEGKYYHALYGGTCDLQREKNRWKLASVKLSPLEQKEILKGKPINFSRE
ncbi:MAG: hypothetical protein RDV48_26920 [Candidatus Eremiobacteraeota bacterium]|nr:hypothetical protein [Candidatus Eremiobacteraeota bacterium]